MASWRAIALITVDSMPMWSAATRSMSMACWATPRKKLPPPTTMPISQPRAWTAAISAAILWMKTASMPKPLPAAKASPEILRRTLLYMSELSIAWGHWKAFVHAKFWLSRVRYSGSCAYSAQGVLLHQDILEVELIFINELAPDVFGARSFLVDAFGMTAWNYLTYHA